MLSCDFCLLHINSNQFQQKSISSKYRPACCLRSHLANLQKYLEKCKHLKNNRRNILHIKMFLVFMTLGYALEFQCTLATSISKKNCHVCSSISQLTRCTLFYENHATSKYGRPYLKIAPRIAKMFVNKKHIMCVLLLHVCTSTPSS